MTTLLLFDIGVSVSYPTVLISALSGLNNEANPNETLRLSAHESSWMGNQQRLNDMTECFILKQTIFR